MEAQEDSQRSFVPTVLPWCVAGASFLLYAITLNHWVSLASLPVVAQVQGVGGSIALNGPLGFLASYPFKALPAAWQPIALNLLAAVCATLTLALLARSVALLPHDRTREQRQRERSEFSLLSIPMAWLPPVFAVVVCGLQLTFWENATAANNEMLDLLLFAYLVRCLLEYRVDHRERWLVKLALVYGLAVTNNWAMIGFFPCFLTALIWIKGTAFFQVRFLLRMLGFGIAGLLLCLVLPAFAIATQSSDASFWELLRAELGAQKSIVLSFPRSRVLLFSLTSILPVLVIGIRWPGSVGDTSVIGTFLGNFMFRVVHAMFLAGCVWVAFDPPFSPREKGYGYAFLPFYYLSALSVGYFSGYFLLVFGRESEKAWRRPSPMGHLLHRLVTSAVFLSFAAVLAGLAWRSFPIIHATGGPLLKAYSDLAAQSLPARPAVVLSDDRFLLLLMEEARNQSTPMPAHIFIDTGSLPYRVYQRHLLKNYPGLFPGNWSDLLAQRGLDDPMDADILTQLIHYFLRSNEVYYLHPSFGFFFESLYPQPHGLAYRLQVYATNEIAPPPLDLGLINENQKLWAQAEASTAAIPLLASKRINDALWMGGCYSRALGFWGVQLQRMNRLDEAGRAFKRAQELSSDKFNFTAPINRKVNESLRQGKPIPLDWVKPAEEAYGPYRTWESRLTAFGPVDEPNLCFEIGQSFAEAGLHRQAALQFIRVKSFEPDNLQAQLWLANMYLMGQKSRDVLEAVKEMRAQTARRSLPADTVVELLRLEALAYNGTGDFARAEQVLLQGKAQYPREETILSTLSQIYLFSRRFTNALTTLGEQLVIAPGKIRALLNQGAIYIETKNYKDAFAPLDRVLKLQPNNRAALMNRAIANLQSGKLDQARADYESLQKEIPGMHSVYYGLGEIAARRNEPLNAIKYYELYLKHAAPETVFIDRTSGKVVWRYGDEVRTVAERIKQLGGSTR